MKSYKNIDTNKIWEEEEVKENYEMFKDKMDKSYESFEDYLEHLLDMGRNGSGGLVEIPYLVVDEDRKTLEAWPQAADSKEEAFSFAKEIWNSATKAERARTSTYVLDVNGEMIWRDGKPIMEETINGIKYNTETARELGKWSTLSPRGYADFYEEILYQKETGEFFLYGEGGPKSKYGKNSGDGARAEGWNITPLSENEAKKWSENYLDADEYISIWGEPEE